MKGTIIFSECEHTGDLDTYAEDVRSCGAIITATEIDTEEETGYISIEVADKQDFLKKFAKTESYGFSSASN